MCYNMMTDFATAASQNVLALYSASLQDESSHILFLFFAMQ